MDTYHRSYLKLIEASKPQPQYYECECGSRLKYGSRTREKFKAHFGTVKHQTWIKLTSQMQQKTDESWNTLK